MLFHIDDVRFDRKKVFLKIHCQVKANLKVSKNFSRNFKFRSTTYLHPTKLSPQQLIDDNSF